VFADHSYDIPDAFRNRFPNGLASAPIIACLVAFACCKLPGFEIDPLQPPPILADLLGPPDDGDDDGKDDSGDDYIETSGESQGGSSTIFPGRVGGNRASVCANSYVFGKPLWGGLQLRVMANAVVTKPIYSR